MSGKQFNASKMDETLPVKGCLGRLPCSTQGKNKLVKQDNKPIVASPPAKLVSKPSAVVLPSPRQNTEGIPSRAMMIRSSIREDGSNNRHRNEAVKGQLSLSFCVDFGTIVVQVLEAKKLKIRSAFANGDSYYVAIELVSNNDDGLRQTTKSVFDENPVFNEEFVLRNFSTSSRLLISLYKSNGNGCDEMVGCMSFGVSSLQQKYSSNPENSSDTYVLLSRGLGMKKHLRSNQMKHLNLLANMTGVSAFSSELNQKSTLHRRTILQDRSSRLSSSGSSGSSMSSSALVSNETTTSAYSNLPSDSMWSCHKAVGGEQYLNSTAKSGSSTGERYNPIEKLTSHFDSCSLSSVSVYEQSSCPGGGSFDLGFSLMDSRRSVSNPFSGLGDSDSSLKLADLISFGMSRSNMDSLNHSDSLPVFPSGASRVEEVCLQLIHAESRFISAMQQGVLRFSRPSRGILSSNEHKILFQNVDKLLVISEYHLKQLSEAWASCTDTIAPLGRIYSLQLSTLCESYLTYFRGLSAADELLGQLLQRAQFAQFLNENPPGLPSVRLDTFLQAPQKHLQNLVCIMDEISSVVDTHRAMYKSLVDVQTGLSNCWRQCITEDQGNCRSDDFDEGIYDDLDEPLMESPPMSEAGSGRSDLRSRGRETVTSESRRESSAEFGLNPDLVQLVKCCQLSKRVKPFQLAVPGRHIVFSGEMDFVENWKWVRTQVFLMNDVIVITKKESNGRLTIIADPIYLKNISTTDFECLHPGEILITSKTESREQPWSHMRTSTFRITAPGLKVTWQHLIQQKLANVN